MDLLHRAMNLFYTQVCVHNDGCLSPAHPVEHIRLHSVRVTDMAEDSSGMN
jgi:hypothetical protein